MLLLPPSCRAERSGTVERTAHGGDGCQQRPHKGKSHELNRVAVALRHPNYALPVLSVKNTCETGPRAGPEMFLQKKAYKPSDAYND